MHRSVRHYRQPDQPAQRVGWPTTQPGLCATQLSSTLPITLHARLPAVQIQPALPGTGTARYQKSTRLLCARRTVHQCPAAGSRIVQDSLTRNVQPSTRGKTTTAYSARSTAATVPEHCHTFYKAQVECTVQFMLTHYPRKRLHILLLLLC